MPDEQPAGSSPAPVDGDAWLSTATPEQLGKWRQTGELPDAPAETPDQPETPPADQPAGTAPAPPAQPAASTDATPQPASEPGDPKTGKGLKARTEALDREIADLNEKLRLRAELRRKVNEPDPSATPPPAAAQQPAHVTPSDDPEPDPDDATKYPDGVYDRKFIRDQALWAGRETQRAADARRAEETRLARIEHGEQEIIKGWKTRVDAARATYPDYDEKVLFAPSEIPKDSILDRWILESPYGALVHYHLQTTPGEVRRLLALPVTQQLIELAELSLPFKSPAAPAKTASDAPPPARTLGGHTGLPGDDVERALEQNDVGAYLQAANARDAAGRRASRR